MISKSSLPEGFRAPFELAGVPEASPVLLAFSGGPDSAVLLFMLTKYRELTGAPVYAAHIDHKIRKDEHDRDREFCEKIAEQYGVKLFTLVADVPAIAKESGESLETAARRVRYDFFEKIMKENEIGILATAHNADDNLETVLLNLTRGSGLKGMRGIPPVRSFGGGVIVRPILDMSKDEILSYAKENSVEYVLDSTNAIADCSRNIIRLKVIPELKAINPSVIKTSKRMSDSVAEDEAYLDGIADEVIQKCSDGIALKELCSLPNPVKTRVIGKLAGGLETVHVKSILKIAEDGVPHSSVSLPGKICAKIENGKLIFAEESAKAEAVELEIKLTEGKNPFLHQFLLVTSHSETNIYKSETQAAIASDKIKGDLFARTRCGGDKIFLRGMHRSLKKLMCDKKLPIGMRDTLPVICDDNGILYVPYIGVRDGMSAKNSDKKTYITLITG